MVPLPPRRPADLGVAAPAPVSGSVTTAPAAAQQQGGGDLLGEIGGFLESLFGGAFGGSGGQSQMPGYEWDALQGWVPSAGKDNAGMMNAARGALAPPAAPDAPQRSVAPVPIPGSGMDMPNLPTPKGAGFGGQRIDLSSAGIPNDFATPPKTAPGGFGK
jgi:hypothetical protein